MTICLFFILTLISLELSVNGDSNVTNTDSRKGETLDLCSLGPEKGSCKHKIKRYYYNPQFGSCPSFTYSGCEGNPNNFHTLNDCRELCPGKFIKTRQPLYCFQEPDMGPCSSNIKSFYYNWKTDNCGEFLYGGCQGNNNRFTSINNCINKCRTYEFSLQLQP